MANLHSSFLEFYNAIQIPPTKKRMIVSSHNHLRKLIKREFNTSHPQYIIGFWIQGSWKMGTTIRTKDDECDLDDGVYITPIPRVTSTTVKRWVQDAVDYATNSGAIHKNKCIRVPYAKGYHIDLPVYVKRSFVKDWEHPQLASRDDGYIESDPRELVKWFERKKKNNRQLVRIISYIKTWSNNVSHKMPSGLALTILAAEAQVKRERDDIALLETLKAIRRKLSVSFVCRVPATPHDDVLKLFVSKKDQILTEFDRIIYYGEKALSEKNTLMASRYWIHVFGVRFPIAKERSFLQNKK